LLTLLTDARGLHNENPSYRLRMFYLFHRFIKEARADIPTNISPEIVNSIRDLLPITVKLPEHDDSEEDLLGEALKSSEFDSQLYLFETAGILCSTLYKSQDQSASLLLSITKPLLDELSVNLQISKANGGQDLIPIIKVHHTIMALGNVSKGFPDYPAATAENYVPPPLDALGQIAQAILVCLENMNIYKPVRDAVCGLFE
jgi:exportin-T